MIVDPAHPDPDLAGAVVAIGNFDGVHLGHRAVIERTMALARARNAAAAVLSFEPHPADYFAGKPVVFRLTTLPQKVKFLRTLGLDGLVVLTFDAALAGLSAEGFVEDVLVRRLGIGAAIVGADFHFGKGRSGTPTFLAQAGDRYGFAVEVLEKVEAEAGDRRETISSSSIRQALERGDVESAARRLGRPYEVSGVVIRGRQLGRTLDMPTANLALEPTNRLAYGVYAVSVDLDGARHDGVASFGVRPTVSGVEPLLETFIFDFSGDIYGRVLTVQIVARLRDEQKFSSLEELKAAMARDAERARALLRRAAA